MAKYHTEGIVKTVALEEEIPRVTIDPVAPYKFTEKHDVVDCARILFVSDCPSSVQTIAQFSETKNRPGVFVDFGSVKDGEVLKSLSLSCGTVRTHRVLKLQSQPGQLPEFMPAFLLDFNHSFRIADNISDQVDFGALLALKQNRTKIRVSISCEPPAIASPAEITDVKICE